MIICNNTLWKEVRELIPISTWTYPDKYVDLSDHFPEKGARGAFADYHITEVSEVMKPMHRNGLKGHQHIAQGIALGRRTIVKFALKGHKPYHASLCFCPCRAPLLRFVINPGRCPGLGALWPSRPSSGTSET